MRYYEVVVMTSEAGGFLPVLVNADDPVDAIRKTKAEYQKGRVISVKESEIVEVLDGPAGGSGK